MRRDLRGYDQTDTRHRLFAGTRFFCWSFMRWTRSPRICGDPFNSLSALSCLRRLWLGWSCRV